MEKKRFTDIHSHIIFGADDGAGSLDEAIELLKLDREEGAYAVFATSHYGIENIYAPDAALVMQKFELLKERAAAEVPEVKLYLGTEWYCAWNLGERIRRREAFRMNDTDYVLVEFLEYSAEHDSADRILTNLAEVKRQGFKPILAHPERYKAMQEDWDLAKRVCDLGVLMQVNAYDLDLNWKIRTKELAQWLATERMVSFIGSDMHGVYNGKRVPKMKEGIRWLYEHTDKEYADAVAFGNAQRLLGVSLDNK
jgi:protein-tyrosine phosphatase